MTTQDSVVTARVPKEIRDRGVATLKQLDSTVTELINAAFEYLIKTGNLPTVASPMQDQPEKRMTRRFSPEQEDRFESYLRATSLPLSSKYASLDVKQIKRMRIEEKYGA